MLNIDFWKKQLHHFYPQPLPTHFITTLFRHLRIILMTFSTQGPRPRSTGGAGYLCCVHIWISVEELNNLHKGVCTGRTDIYNMGCFIYDDNVQCLPYCCGNRKVPLCGILLLWLHNLLRTVQATIVQQIKVFTKQTQQTHQHSDHTK